MIVPVIDPGAQAIISEFRYSREERRDIVSRLQPLWKSTAQAASGGASADDLAIRQMESYARVFLSSCVRRSSRDERRNYYRKVSASTVSLLELLNERSTLDGGSALYLIRDWLDRQQTSEAMPPATFLAALEELAKRAADAAANRDPPYPGYRNHYPNVRDPEKVEFAEHLLMEYRIETNRKQGRSKTGPAAMFLIAAMDPVMTFARNRVGITEATLLNSGHNAQYLIRVVSEAGRLGESLPIFRGIHSPSG